MKVYVAVYNPCTYESGYCPISLHRTQEGADDAIANHKAETGHTELWQSWGVYLMELEI